MPSVAKILSLLALATSLRVSSTSPPPYWYSVKPGYNLIFNEEAYRGRSHAFGYCPENYSGLNTSCTFVHVDELGHKRQCGLDVKTLYDILEPGQVQLWLLGAHKAIVSKFVPTSSANKWQVYVVNFLDCSNYQPRGLQKLVPVKFIVYEKSFYAIVNSATRSMPCYREPNRSRNVQRCWIKFNDLGSITGPRYWYKLSADNDDFAMAPLQEDTNVLEDFLMIRLFRRAGKTPVFAEALIQGWAKGRSEHLPDQRRRLLSHDSQHKSISLRKYTVLDSSSAQRGLDPRERIAYSTHAGYIGVCAKKEDMVLICSQYDDDGRLQWEHTFRVDPALVNFYEMAVMNLAGDKPGMLLLMASCKDPACHASRRNEYRVARIGLDSYQLETVHKIPKLTCDRYTNRASGKLFEDGPGKYCFTQACYEDFFVESHKDKNQKRSRQLKLDRHCFTDSDLTTRQVVEYVEVDWSKKLWPTWINFG